MEKPTGRMIVEAVEIRAWTRVEAEDGTILSKARTTHRLDPSQFTMGQHQQFDRSGEKPTPVGNPYLLLHGVLIGSQNDPIVQKMDQELSIQMEKLAGVIHIKAAWAGKEILEYEIAEQLLLTEEMKHHVALITGRIRAKVGEDAITEDAVKELLGKAMAKHFSPKPPSPPIPLFPASKS